MKGIAAIVIAMLCSMVAVAQELPQDSNRCTLTVITHSDWQKRPVDSNLIDTLTQGPKMSGVVKKCHFEHVLSGSDIYKYRWSEVYPELPAVILQQPSGIVIYKASGENIPPDDESLYEEMEATYRKLTSIAPTNLPKRQFADEDEDVDVEPPIDSVEFLGGDAPIRNALGMTVLLFGFLVALIVALIVLSIIKKD